MQIGVDHFGHFALTGLLLPQLLATGNARVVTVSSLASIDGIYEIENLSIGGCMLRSGPDCSLGDSVGVTLHVDGESDIELPARVVRNEHGAQGANLGLCFTDTDPLFEDRIQDLVMRSIERERRNEILVVHQGNTTFTITHD